jgi:DNA-nicking Smr family endonuclease|tara:strand:+ start:11661 stop:12212 length:552 start_codon:yes stop_codon:yes gene_type:complete
MSNKDNDNIFLKSLEGVRPIKKNNKIIKPIPKSTKSHSPKTIIKKTDGYKIDEKIKNVVTQKKIGIQKSDINIKLKKNKIPINRKVDFHGCSLDEAKKIFFNTINDCFSKNYRCILFITGKGSIKKVNDHSQEIKLYYGKIRSNFLDWTNHKAAQSKILNIQQASIKSGGDGAFFVYLRKNKN